MRKRIFFNKTEEMKYISHLDLIRFLERIFKKAHIDVKYTEGFHPRPKMSFLNPISLGTEAYSEPMDIEINEDLENEVLKQRINDIDIIGFKIEKVIDIDKRALADDFESINYEIYGSELIIKKLYELFMQDEIIETKEKKGKITSRNLKDRIVNFVIDNNFFIKLTLINMSPNSFLNLLNIPLTEVEIKRTGYNESKKA